MCGIAGLVERGVAAQASLAAAMTRAIRHRGPDHSAVYTEGPVALGYVRLSILDLSAAGNQPMWDASGDYVAVYNGETYNYREIGRQLEQHGIRFRSGTDTEVVVNLFAREGVAGIQRLNGMFALAIWSRRDRELWLFRDPIGVKPLYYQLTPQRFLFASEIKALLEVAPELPELAADGVLNYLTYGHSLAPATIFRGIFKLPPGHYARIRNNELSLRRYFDFPLSGGSGTGDGQRRRSDQDWTEEAATVLESAVHRQMVADVPVGIFLSGGIDSSLLAALASRHHRRLRTFSVGFAEGPDYDETADARLVADYLGAQHNELIISSGELTGVLDRLAWQFDEPFADAANLPVYLLSRFARSQVTVALSGEGGDEMFGGYRRYAAENIAGLYQRLPAWVHSLAIRAAATRGDALRLNRLAQTLIMPEPSDRYSAWLRVFHPAALARLLTDDWQAAMDSYDAAAVYRDLFQRARGAGTVDRLLFADAQTWLPDTYLEKIDKATMAVSLEARVPFLDLNVVQFAARCPARLKMRNFVGKYILRRLARSVLPSQIARKPKHGFAVPTGLWFRGKLQRFVQEILLDPRTCRRGMFRRPELEALLTRHLDSAQNCEAQVWTLLMLELWMRQVLDRRSRCQDLCG